jgi:hypothetical protein
MQATPAGDEDGVDEEIARFAAREHALVTRHVRTIPKAQRPVVSEPRRVDAATLLPSLEAEATRGISVFRRADRKSAKNDARAAAMRRAAELNAQYDARAADLEVQAKAAWAELRAHRGDRVIAALDEAFAANGIDATCENAGSDGGRNTATIVVIFGSIALVPDRVAAQTAAGVTVAKRRTKTERNALYIEALGSQVLLTVKQAFASAPGLDDANIVVLRHNPDATKVPDRLQPIYIGTFARRDTARLAWKTLDPTEHVLGTARADLRRSGVAGDVAPLDVRKNPHLVTIVAKYRDLLESRRD